ncbi:MAG: hypothetical protein MJE68_23205 [Proteobacteria bacterium]|nr:hypothetical protein [Pseudomonadota bacterium]
MAHSKTTKPRNIAALAADHNHIPNIAKSMDRTSATLKQIIWMVVIYDILFFLLLCYLLYHAFLFLPLWQSIFFSTLTFALTCYFLYGMFRYITRGYIIRSSAD